MENQNTVIDDWRKEITPSTEILKVKDGESVEVTFADEGTPKTHPDFGNSVMFLVLTKGSSEPKKFYVKSNNFNLLGKIKELGTLTGTKVKITRVGSKKSDTRYSINKI